MSTAFDPTDRARISRTHASWRVRVPGHAPEFFADSTYDGDTDAALSAAQAWRDARWDGSYPGQKLTPLQRKVIARSTDHYLDVAKRYGISPSYVHQLRRRAGGKS